MLLDGIDSIRQSAAYVVVLFLSSAFWDSVVFDGGHNGTWTVLGCPIRIYARPLFTLCNHVRRFGNAVFAFPFY